MHFTAKERFVTTQMGRIHCFDAGSGPALMLVHSNGASAYEYEFVIDMLAKKYRVIAWDMPGQGDSDNPPRFYSAHDYADSVVALMDSLGIEKASMAGSSVGGSIAVALGARHAARMERVPVVLDGYVAAAAAAVVAALAPGGIDHCLAAHVEPGEAHARVLERLGKRPLLSLGVDAGEGCGAALAAGLVKAAVEAC